MQQHKPKLYHLEKLTGMPERSCQLSRYTYQTVPVMATVPVKIMATTTKKTTTRETLLLPLLFLCVTVLAVLGMASVWVIPALMTLPLRLLVTTLMTLFLIVEGLIAFIYAILQRKQKRWIL